MIRRSVIVDEFNANSGWTLMNNLLTTKKQGKDGRGRYWFADNNEWIDIPEDWHVYFTANIGRQYGRAAIRPDFGSRIGSKVTEVQNPPKEDEWLLAGVKMCDAKRNIVLDAKSQYQLGVFILEALPSIRELMRSSSETSFPISFRVLEDILKKLINYSGGVPRAREDRTVDEAILGSVLRPYKLWESRELPKQIALQLIERGLLLDPKIEKEVIAISGFTAAELAEKRKVNEEIDPEKALQQLNDKQMNALTASPPALLAF